MLTPWAMLLVSCGSATLGEPPSPAPPAIAGPHVPAESATLVRRDLEGRVIRPDHPIEEDAIRLIELDEAVRAKVDAVLARRAQRMDRALLDHLDLLIEAQATFAAGSPAERASMVQRITHALEPVTADGTLDRQIRDVLPPEPRRKFAAMLREYWNAVIDDGRRGVHTTEDPTMAERPPGAGPEEHRPEPAVGVIARDQLAMLGGEIRRSFERLQKSGGLLYAILTRGVEVTEQQRSRALAACEEFARRTGAADPAPGELARFVATLAPIFDDRQREQVIINARGGYRPKAPTKPDQATTREGAR